MKEETIVLHAGHRKDESTTSVAVPIYQTTSYQFDSTDHALKTFFFAEIRKYLYKNNESNSCSS